MYWKTRHKYWVRKWICSRRHFAKQNLSCFTIEFSAGNYTNALFPLSHFFCYISIVQQVRNPLHYFPHFIISHFSHTPLLHSHWSYVRCVSVPSGECYVRMMDRWFWYSWQERHRCIFCTHSVGLAGNLGNEFRSQGNSGCVCKEFCEDLLSEELEREQRRGKME